MSPSDEPDVPGGPAEPGDRAGAAEAERSSPPGRGWGGRLRSVLTAGTSRSRSATWRLAVPAVLALAGVLFVSSAISSRGTDLRAGRYGDLAGLAAQESRRVEALRDRVGELSREVDRLSRHTGNRRVEAVQRQVDALREPAGLQAVHGPGLTITLDDAPEEVVKSADIDPSRLVVHQQDIQAVANALWAGGAEAMTIQGQRVISTTGIKCVGNTVILHGVPYSPPYVISAVGDPAGMLNSVEANPYIGIYQQYVDAYRLGWSLKVDDRLDLPAYAGTPDLSHARPAGTTGRATGGG